MPVRPAPDVLDQVHVLPSAQVGGRSCSVPGEDVDGATSETVGHVATHVLFRGIGVAIENGAPHGLVFLLYPGPVGGG